MKKMKSFLQVLMSVCAVLGWWGFLYPELTLTQDTVKIISMETECTDSSDGTESSRCLSAGSDTSSTGPEDCSSWNYGRSLYYDLLVADSDQIVLRSKLLTNLSLFWEALQNGNK